MAAIARWIRNWRRRWDPLACAWIEDIEPSRAAIGACNTRVAERAGSRGVAEGLVKAVQVALDELLTNVVMHATPEPGARIRLQVDCERDWIEARISYPAPAFDPTAQSLPDVDAPLADRSPGGLGLLLVHRMMDVFEHRYADGHNHLRVRKQLRPDASDGSAA